MATPHSPEHPEAPGASASSTTSVKQYKGGISSRVGQLIYGHKQNDAHGVLRADKRNFIRALLGSYFPIVGAVAILIFRGNVNLLAADFARNIKSVEDFKEDITADRISVESAVVNLGLNPVFSYLASREIIEFFATQDTASLLAGGVTIMNLLQAYLVLKLAREDHSATVTSGGQKLKDIPPDQGFRSTTDH